MSFQISSDQMTLLFGSSWKNLTKLDINSADPDSIVGRAIAAQGSKGAWRQAYLTLAGYATTTTSTTYTDPSTGMSSTETDESPTTGVDPSAWLWLRGAADANAGVGYSGSFIRDYTSIQYQLRTGSALDESEIYKSSAAVALNVFTELLPETAGNDATNVPVLPTISIIASQDAAAIANTLFGGDFAPWSGALLFPYLGIGGIYEKVILKAQSNKFVGEGDISSIASQQKDTYDLVSLLASDKPPSAFDAPSAYFTLQNAESTNRLGSDGTTQLLATLATDTDAYLTNFYGLGSVDALNVGSRLFPISLLNMTAFGLNGFGLKASVGNLDANNQISVNNTDRNLVNAGPGDDTVIVNNNQLPPMVGGETPNQVLAIGTSVLDGGAGFNSLRYNVDGSVSYKAVFERVDPSSTGIDQAPTARLRVIGHSAAAPDTTDLAYRFQQLTLGSGNDIFSISPGLKLNDLQEGSGAALLSSVDGGGGTNALDFSGDPENLQVAIKMKPAGQPGGASAALTTQISGTGDASGNLLATNFQQLSLGTGDDTVKVDPNVASSTKLVVNGGGGNNIFSVGGGTEALIGGSGNNTFEIDEPTGAPTSDIIWGGGGTSTYYINGAPNVYIFYVDDPTAAKIAALTPDIISSTYSWVQSPKTFQGDFHLPGLVLKEDSIVIINPTSNDRIYNNGVLLSDINNWQSPSYTAVSGSYTQLLTPTYQIGPANVLSFFNPAPIGSPGPDTVQSLPSSMNSGNMSFGLSLFSFKLGDFGITYSGPVYDGPIPPPEFTGVTQGPGNPTLYDPDPGFLSWSVHNKLSIQSSVDAGNQLNSANGNIMSGVGGVTYSIDPSTTSSLISSEGGSQDSTVNFLGSATATSLVLAGGAGTDGLGLLLQDPMSGQTVTVLDGLGTIDNRVSGVSFSDGSALSYAQVIQTLTTGTATQAKLYGDTDANVIDSNGYASYEQGNGGGDTLIYNQGYGQLEINEIDSSATPNNVLQFGSGIVSSQLTAIGSSNGSLTLYDGLSGDKIQIDGQLSNSDDGVQLVTFADGSSLTRSQLNALATTGTSAADTLFGTSNAEVFDGKGAPTGSQDYEVGGGGGDVFVYDEGYGRLEIYEYDTAANPSNILQLGAGITAAQLTITADPYGNVYLADGQTGDQIELDNQRGGSSAGVQLIQFADGSTLTAAQIETLLTTGTSDADTLYGTSGADILDGKGAPAGTQDFEQGQGGGDIFVFDQGYGRLEVSEFDYSLNPSNVLQLGAGITQANLTVSADAYGNLYLGDGTSGDQIKLDAQRSGSFYGVQTVQFADGSSLTAAQLASLAMVGTSGADTIYGTSTADVLDGKGAPAGSQDYESGGGGGDTFVFNAGYGQLEIMEIDYGTQPSNTLLFGPGVTASQLTVSADASGSFLLRDGVSGDLIKLDYQRYGGPYGVQSVQFADGTSLSTAQLAALAMAGTPGPDTITGTSGADVLDGKGAPAGSQDYIQGNGGGDTFIYNPGYGQLEISEIDYSGQPNNTLLFGPGITASQLTVSADASGNFLLTDGVTGDLIKLDYQRYGGPYGVQSVQFADGTSLSTAQLAALAMAGTPGADTIIGTSGADVLDGKGAPAGSQDYIQGNGGGDTFIYNPGYGQLEISEFDYSGSADVLDLGAGITLSQLTVTSDGLNVYLTDGVAGDQIKIDYGAFNVPYVGIGAIQFADGTSLTRAGLLALAGAKNGTVGADSLSGGSEANTFDGKGAPAGGQDYESGGGGGDTFIFNAGYGQLEINELDYSWGPAHNALQFGPGIIASQLVVSADASGNLDVTDGIAGDLIQIDGQLNDIIAGGSHGVQSFTFADGSSLALSQLTIPVTGTTGADSLHAGVGKDVFDGLGAPAGSQDYEQGNGSATFVFDAGYGQLEVKDDAGFYNNTSAVLQLGSGITPGQVSITADPSGNIVVTDGVINDQIQIDAMNTQGYGGYSQFGVRGVQFADGTVWSSGQILSLAANGTTGSDTITGTAGGDILDGRGGTDMITGGGGNDTYLFSSGYGSLTIDNSDPNGTSAQGQIDLGLGLTEQTLWFAQSGNDLLITHLGSSDTIDVAGWFGLDPGAQIATIKGADGLQSGTSDVGQLVSAMATYASANPTFSPASAASMPTDATLQSALQTYWHT